MPFFVQGPGIFERMPLANVFNKRGVEKIDAVVAEHAIGKDEHGSGKEQADPQHTAAQAYQSVSELPQNSLIVLARKIMVSPVQILRPQATIDEALTRLREKKIRHLPVVSSTEFLIGILSDRDIFRNLGGINENYQSQARKPGSGQVQEFMKSPVLTASEDTDVRHIARLFVEQHIGALPIVTDGALKGIVTRSDVLKAIMRHFSLELWV
jgi:acetoin utilization protein AcuB